MLEGLEAVAEQILNPKEPAANAGPPTHAPPDKAPSPAIQEARLVKALLDEFSPNLIRQGKDFFRYTGTHWEHMEPLSTPDYFKRIIDRMAGGKLKFKDIQSAYSRFFIHVPLAPDGVSLFAPNPYKQNFRNGTLDLAPNSDGTFKIGFTGHRREDYLIHCHDFEYREDAELNPEFEAALDRIWSGDPDIEAKKQAYFEVLGACLVSAFRKLVLFVGQPKTGKSTLILFAANMVHEKYRCSVDPTQFAGFNLETMAGKLLNFDTDINLVKPITDSILKKVEDRSPMRISRKGIADIYAPIPGMHLYGANRMPMSHEAGQAYDRRMLVFRCAKFQPKGDAFIQDFAQHVWRQGAQGIVARAVQGLKRLCANGGHFTVPESSKQEVADWQKGQGDIVQDFLLDISQGGASSQNTQISLGEQCVIRPRDLWEFFKLWVESFHPRHIAPGKIKFYGRLKDLGIETKTVKGIDYFVGVGTAPDPESLV
jgi:phage/plasmid-associated DNA primase